MLYIREKEEGLFAQLLLQVFTHPLQQPDLLLRHLIFLVQQDLQFLRRLGAKI